MPDASEYLSMTALGIFLGTLSLLRVSRPRRLHVLAEQQVIPNGVELLACVAIEDGGNAGLAFVIVETGHFGVRIDAQGIVHPAEIIVLTQARGCVHEVDGRGFE